MENLYVFKVKKRKSFHKEAALNEIYIRNKRHNNIYLKRIHKLFDKKSSRLYFFVFYKILLKKD